MRCRGWLLTVAALAASAPTVEAQQKIPAFSFGLTAGRLGVRPFAFSEQPVSMINNNPTIFDGCGTPSAEEIFGAHLGAAIARAVHLELHAEANTATWLECSVGIPFRFARSVPAYTDAEYQGRTVGHDYLAILGRIVVEPPVPRGIIRPRVSTGVGRIPSKSVWVWQAAAGVSVGGARTRAVFDAGEDLYRSHYVRVLRTHDSSGKITVVETQRGTEHSHGYAVRIGIEHYFR
jgi:hypothetical protein